MGSLLSLLKLLLIISGGRSFCYAQDIGETQVMTTHACQGAWLYISCPNVQHVINVIYANYGRTSHQICPDQNIERVTDCVLESSLKIVKNICQGKNNCVILANQLTFRNDSCPDVKKYLEVNYTCGIQDGPSLSCNSANTCNETTEVCVDTNAGGVVCECAQNYHRRVNGGSCQAVSCQSAVHRCDAETQRCEDLNPGIRCVCAEGYVRDDNSQCTAATCRNSPRSCNSTTERCQDHGAGIECICADGYVRNRNNECVAATCRNSPRSCNSTTERCQDHGAGIECICADGYVRNRNNECVAATCRNSPRSCNSTTERCQDHGAGIECICADGYVRNRNNECVANSCLKLPNYCNAVSERCQDRGADIECVCAENYHRDMNNECVAITCKNSARMCNIVTQRCEDLNPGIRCVCVEGYARTSQNGCTEMKVNDSTTDTPEQVTRCPADVISIGGIALSFPSAATGEKVDSNQTCSQQLLKNQTHPLATRVCNQVWQEPELQNCFDVDTPEEQLDVIRQLNLTDVTIDQIANSLSLLTYQNDNISAHVLDVTVESLARIVEFGSPSLEVTDAVVGIVNSIMQINETVLDESKEVASVIPLMEKQITNIQRNEQNYSQSLQNLNISAIKLQKSAFEGDFNLVDHSTDVNGLKHNESVHQTSITLPYSVIEVVNEVYPKSTAVPVTFVTYRDSILFRENDNDRSDNRNATNEYIASYVISSTVELPNITISGLPQNSSVIVSFSNMMLYERGNDAKSEVLCVYWEYTSENGEGKWSQTGCRTLSSGLKDVTCSCDHLTSFAVLVRTYDEEETGFHLVLQLITIIGCIISIVGLFSSLLCMIIIRKVRGKQQTHIHLNLCFALLGLYLSFLFGVGQADQPEMCRAMASVIYFFCLSSMAWMSVEAFYIYKLIWKCKQHNIKHLIPVGVSFAWGLPGIAAVVIYFLDNTHDYEAEPDYCFIHPGPVLLYGFLLELLILFLYNSTVFVLVTYRISCRKIQAWNKDDRHQEMVIRVKSTFLFWLLLGISWIFGFLATFEHPTSIVFQIIFCVLLSLQGFFMFYMLIVQNPEMKKGISSISSFRSQSSSIQLGMHSSTAHSNQEQSRQENSSSLDHVYNSNNYV